MPAQASAAKRDQLERLFDRYEDLAAEVVLKEDLLTEGVAIGSDDRLAGLREPWRSLMLEGGPYKLFRTMVRPPTNPDSPYAVAIDPMDGRPVLQDRVSGAALCYVREYPVMPEYFERTFPGGLRFGDVVQPDGTVRAFEPCPDNGAPACATCAAQGRFWREEAAGTSVAIHVRSPQAVAAAAFAAVAQEHWPLQEAPLHLAIDTGFLPATYEGASQADFFVPYVEAIVGRLHAAAHILMRIPPQSNEIETALLRAGVTVRAIPLGVWDEALHRQLYPALAAHLPWQDLVRYLTDMPYLHGAGSALVDMEIGAELVGGRFGSTREALTATARGFKFLTAHGCLPRLFRWQGPFGALRPTVDYFLDVDRAWYQAWMDALTDEPHGYIMGIGRSRFPYSASWEVGRGGPPEYARKWDPEKFGQPGYRVPVE